MHFSRLFLAVAGFTLVVGLPTPDPEWAVGPIEGEGPLIVDNDPEGLDFYTTSTGQVLACFTEGGCTADD